MDVVHPKIGTITLGDLTWDNERHGHHFTLLYAPESWKPVNQSSAGTDTFMIDIPGKEPFPAQLIYEKMVRLSNLSAEEHFSVLGPIISEEDISMQDYVLVVFFKPLKYNLSTL